MIESHLKAGQTEYAAIPFPVPIMNVRALSIPVYLLALLALLTSALLPLARAGAMLTSPQGGNICTRPFLSVSPALTDLGAGEYVRMDHGPTGFTGGLYPGGVNQRPAAHTQAGLSQAALVMPRDSAGLPDPNGKIGLLAVGMSNTAGEFFAFMRLARSDPSLNPRLVLINGAQPGKVASEWIDLNADTWQYVDDMLQQQGVTDAQVQVAWVKLTNFLLNDFPAAQVQLQGHLLLTLHNLKAKFPNLALAYFSSRTRSYTYWEGQNPEPGAFETGFAVKWLVQAQLAGDPELNFDPALGEVKAPWIAWGPYLWADGHNARSDGFVWLETDMVWDCTHPSPQGEDKVARLLMDFLKIDPTARNWFLADGAPPTPTLAPTPTPPTYQLYLPGLQSEEVFDYPRVQRRWQKYYLPR